MVDHSSLLQLLKAVDDLFLVFTGGVTPQCFYGVVIAEQGVDLGKVI